VILNPYSVLAAFAATLRVVLGLLVLSLGLRRRGPDEGRYYLLFTLSVTLVGVAVVSWPLLYLVLQSYVPEWPRVMCIQGVTRIGAGSLGAPASLPLLLDLLEATKPLLVLAAGAWLVLHLGMRAERTGAPGGRVLAGMLAAAGLAAADGALELAYLFIPKSEKFLSVGCCTFSTLTAEATGKSLHDAMLGGGGRTPAWLAPAYFAVTALTYGALHLRSRRWPSVLLALLSVPVTLLFLREVASPAFLRLPYHRCIYCMLKDAPESIVAVALFATGALATLWAAFARDAQREPLRRAARFGYLASMLMMAVRLLIP